MTKKSKRELERDVEQLKETDGPVPIDRIKSAFMTDDEDTEPLDPEVVGHSEFMEMKDDSEE